MNGVNLKEMESSQMVDVIHYYFDEDMRYATVESAQMHGKLRETIFGSFYGYDYKYSIKTSDSNVEGSNAVKPYIPPTEFDPDTGIPLNSRLDGPLG